MESIKTPKFVPVKNTDDQTIHLYCDGGSRITAKKGESIRETDKCAYAYFLKQGGNEKLDGWAGYGQTNNAMEISALLNALRAIKRPELPISAHLDSAYVVNCLQNQWWKKWKRDGWTKKGGLANAQLWKELIEELERFPFFSIYKVKGHAGDKWNELVDAHLNKLMDELPEKGKRNLL